MQLREDFGYDVAHELMLGGNPFRDALIDLSQRGRHNALARLRLFALCFHASPAVERVLRHLRRDTEFSIKAIPAVAQLITRRGGGGLGNSLTSSARSRATRSALFVSGKTPSTRARRSPNWVLTRFHSSVCKRLF